MPRAIILTSIPWRLTCVGILLVLALVYFSYSTQEGAQESGVDWNADPLHEFQRVLSQFSTGALADEQSWKDFTALVANTPVRQWIIANYATAPRQERLTLMSVVLETAPEKRYEEFARLLQQAIQQDIVGVMACKALRYYELPNRRELLRSYIEMDCESNPYHIQSALRVYLDLYGSNGIAEVLDRHLACQNLASRGHIASIMTSRCEDEQVRLQAQASLTSLLDAGYRNWSKIYGFFDELVKTRACGGAELLRRAKYLAQEETVARDVLERYALQCEDGAP